MILFLEGDRDDAGIALATVFGKKKCCSITICIYTIIFTNAYGDARTGPPAASW